MWKETLNARGEKSRNIFVLSHGIVLYTPAFSIISSPLFKSVSPSEKAVAIGSFFFFKPKNIIIGFCGMYSSVPMTLVQELSK